MSVLELLIAFILASLLIVNITTLTSAGQDLAINNYNYIRANSLAQKAVDSARAASRKDFSHLLNVTAYDSIYKTTIIEQFTGSYTKEITATVAWQKPNGQSAHTELSTAVSDWGSIVNGNVCTLSGNWTQPRIVSVLPFNNNLTDIKITGNLAYVTSNGSSAGMADLYIVDISSPTTPVILSQINTGPGLSSITIAGRYAFVGNTSINAQLQVIDILDPAHPALIKSYKLPGTYNDNTTIPNTVLYSDNKIYMGTQKSQIAELHIIDVANPLAPNEVGTYETDAGIFGLKINDARLYVASAANTELNILNIDDPGHILLINGVTTSNGRGKSLTLINQNVLFGRTQGAQELSIYDNSNSINALGQYRVGSSIYSLTGSSGLLFLGTSDANKQLQMWNISDPGSAAMIGQQVISGKANVVACGIGLLFVLGENPAALYIISN